MENWWGTENGSEGVELHGTETHPEFKDKKMLIN